MVSMPRTVVPAVVTGMIHHKDECPWLHSGSETFILWNSRRISHRPGALFSPAAISGDCQVAIGARNRDSATSCALGHGIEVVVEDCCTVIYDPDVDVIENALPKDLHAPETSGP